MAWLLSIEYDECVMRVKQVDIIQMCVLEFENRPLDDRFYHLEHYIEGRYTKYNSNSGFVDECIRFTPQVCSPLIIVFDK